MALLLHHRHHLAQVRQSLHIIRSLHVVFRLVHHRPGPHILVRLLSLLCNMPTQF